MSTRDSAGIGRLSGWRRGQSTTNSWPLACLWDYRSLVVPGVLVLMACGDERGAVADPVAEAPAVQFVDVAALAGLDFLHHNGFSGEYFYMETAGSGGGFVDYDGDGWLDVYLVNGAQLIGRPLDHPPTNHLFRSYEGLFEDVSAGSGTDDSSYGIGCTTADYDNDGDQDLYVTNFGANLLLRNEGDGRFRDVTAQAGVGDPRWSTGSGFFDYDNDGDLDLMAVNYLDFTLDKSKVCKKGPHRSYCDPTEYDPAGDVLYRNDASSASGNTAMGGSPPAASLPSFTDVTERAGVTWLGRSLGIAFADFDRDGDTDVYIANDKDMNFLYENRQGRFEEVGLQAGTRYNAQGVAEAGMGIDFGDVDNDGHPEIHVCNFSHETNTLYVNDGRGGYRDATTRFGLAQGSYLPLAFGTRFMDYDNDGYLDLFVANGHALDNVERIHPELSYRQPNQMMRNLQGREFADVSAFLGAPFAQSAVSRGAAVGDYDNDGDLDILVTNIADRPNLLRNDGGSQGNWLVVALTGAAHRDAIGTRVVVVTERSRQVRERQTGGSYLSIHDPRLHFGLGEAPRADLEITWPDGEVQTIGGVAANQVLRVTQPGAGVASP